MAALRAAVFPLSAKNQRGGHFPPSGARVNSPGQLKKTRFFRGQQKNDFLLTSVDIRSYAGQPRSTEVK